MAIVTINNYEQRQVDQRMVTSELINNGLLSAGRQMIGKAASGIKGLGKKSGDRLKTRYFGSPAGVGTTSRLKPGKSALGIQAKRGGLRARNMMSKHPKSTMAAAGIGAGLGAGAHARHVKNSPGYKAALKKDRG